MSKISQKAARRPAVVASLVVFFVGLVLVGAAAWFEHQVSHREFDDRLEAEATEFTQSVEQGIAEIEASLAGVSGLFVASNKVSLLDYRRYIDHIDLPAGLLGVAYSPIVQPMELADFESEMARLIPGYTVWDWSPDGPIVPASHPEYYPVKYFEPIAAQASSYGLNAVSPPGRRALIEAVVAGGQDKASPLTPLAISNRLGVLIYRPVVQSNTETIGVLTAPVDLESLVVAAVDQELLQLVDWSISDITATPTAAAGDHDFAGHGHVASRRLTVTDREWRVDVIAVQGRAPAYSAAFYAIIGLGLILAGLLAAGTHLVVKRRQTQLRLEEVEGLLEAKESFIASVSHELRTPLTGVLGFAEALRDWSDTMSSAERDELVGTIASEAGELSNIVEDLIVMARSDYGTLEVVSVPVDLKAQCAQVLEMTSAVHNVPVEVGAGVTRAAADPARVRQIIRNLMTNAESYGGGNRRILIERDGSDVAIAVCDDGDGVPEGFEEKIFAPYERAHQKSGKAASIGLGLSISRKLAQAMKGDLWYERVGSETRFVLRLPVQQQEHKAA